MTAGKDSVGKTVMNYAWDALKVQPQKSPAALPTKEHWQTIAHIHAASKHLWPKLNNLYLCAILVCMVPWQWKSTYWIHVSEVVATYWMKLLDKCKQIQAGEATATKKIARQTQEKSKKLYSRVLPLMVLALRYQGVELWVNMRVENCSHGSFTN